MGGWSKVPVFFRMDKVGTVKIILLDNILYKILFYRIIIFFNITLESIQSQDTSRTLQEDTSLPCLFQLHFLGIKCISCSIHMPCYAIPQASQRYTRKLSIKLDEATAASVIYQLQLLDHTSTCYTFTFCIYNSISFGCILRRLQHFRCTRGRLAFICRVDCDSLWSSPNVCCV